MADPKRILAKLLPPETDLLPFEATGEPLELVVQLLRDVVKLRRVRAWLAEAGVEVAVSPSVFLRLLDIPAINFIETPNRNLDVEVVSLRDTRQPEDPVAIGHLNAVLRELYRSLFDISESLRKDHQALLLVRDISAVGLEQTAAFATQLKSMNGQLTGYLLTAGRAKKIEQEFRALFPHSTGAHPLRRHLPAIEHELGFYRQCVKAGEKWAPLGLDVLRLLREDRLTQARDNVEEMGNLLWSLVYNSPRVRQSLLLAGIGFADIGPLFDERRAPLRPF